MNERHTRFEECCQLLVEDEELLLGDTLRLRQLKRKPADRAFRLKGENEQSLFLELVAQARLAVRGVNALYDLSVWRSEPAPELHGIRPFLCNWLSQRTLSARKYIKSRKVFCRL